MLVEEEIIVEQINKAINVLEVASPSILSNYILNKSESIKPRKLDILITACTVNNPLRLLYSQNKNPRKANTALDILYRLDTGNLTRYKPAMHGDWEIRLNSSRNLTIGQIGSKDLLRYRTPDKASKILKLNRIAIIRITLLITGIIFLILPFLPWYEITITIGYGGFGTNSVNPVTLLDLLNGEIPIRIGTFKYTFSLEDSPSEGTAIITILFCIFSSLASLKGMINVKQSYVLYSIMGLVIALGCFFINGAEIWYEISSTFWIIQSYIPFGFDHSESFPILIPISILGLTQLILLLIMPRR